MAHIGDRLNKVRKERGLTLQAVTKLTGVATSTLSKIENGKSSPNYTILARICAGLEVAVAELAGEVKHLAVGARTINRHWHLVPQENREYPLSCELEPKGLRPAILHVGPHFGTTARRGETLLYVLSGSIIFRMASYHEEALLAGDSVHFMAAAEHSIESVGNVIATVLMVSL